MTIKKISCIGAGFKGGTFSSVVALKCPGIEVHVIDESREKIEQWNSDKIPVFEPGLKEILSQCLNRNLFFTSDVAPLKTADVIFICADVTTRFYKAAEKKALENAIRLIVSVVDCSKIIVEKSTAAIQATEMMSNILKAHEEPYKSFVLISNPEFLKEGCAVNEALNPDTVLIGADNTPETAGAVEALISIYEHWVPRSRIVTADMWTVELSNLVETALLIQTITSVNAMAAICEVTDADITKVTEVIGMDPRIGVKNLESYIGLQSINFHNSIESIINLCQHLRLPKEATYWQKLLLLNDCQKQRFVTRIMDAFCNSVVDRCMVVLGFSLKKDTACTENSAGAFVSKMLLKEGVKLNICDPVVPEEVIMKDLADVFCESPLEGKIPDFVKTFSDPYEAATGAQAIILCTDWPQFVNLDFQRLFKGMVKPAYIFDGNLKLPHKELQKIGFQVQTYGRPLNV